MKQVTEKKLRSWLDECYRTQCTHMLLVVDRTDNFVINPVKIFPNENVQDVIDFYFKPETEVVEVYSMNHSIDEQLEAFEPVFNYD